MNQLLDVTGALLYIIFSIVLFPIFMALQILMWSLTAINHIKIYHRNILKRAKHRKPYQLPHVIELIIERKWFAPKSR